jgi:LysR family cys regulon transcriptional activator
VKLQQLRYLTAIAKNNLNISAAAESLYTSQPGVSKQIRLLEDELGVEIFNRNGKHLSHITSVGEQIIKKAEQILGEVRNIQTIAAEFRNDQLGSLSIATTHTQARYALPPVIQAFRERYPSVSLQIQQGSPAQIAELVVSGEVDFAIATEAVELFEDLIMMPCYLWNRSVITPLGHELIHLPELTLEAIVRYPLVTYVFGFTGHSKLDEAFRNAKLDPKVVFTATDTDVIKTYVRLGLGVGIIAAMAFDPERDQDLVKLDASHLFPSSITRIGFRRGSLLRAYMHDFIQLFAPHLTSEVIEAAQQAPSNEAIKELFDSLVLPVL